MFEYVIIGLSLLVLIAFLTFDFKYSRSKTFTIDELTVITKDGDMKLLDYISMICSEATKEVLEQQLEGALQESFKNGYEKGFEDMKEQSIRIIQDESLNEQIEPTSISTIKS